MSTEMNSAGARSGMKPRDPSELHRQATPLELLYDLCFVVAVAHAATGLHHGIAEGHAWEATRSFGIVFFAIWWAWMNFAWFASAFDPDDAPYRIKVFIQLVGVLVLAAGVPAVFEHEDFRLMTVGYTIMRVGMLAQWIRAARSVPELRATALRYARGLVAVQAGWLGLLALPSGLWLYGFVVLAAVELAIPWWAESARRTPWHPEHIAERYGLFTIIVIGESVLAGTLAVRSAMELDHTPASLAAIVVSAPVILFAMWWVYFARPGHALLTSNRAAFLWGYGHYLILASAAAAGAGIAVLVDHATHHGHASDLAAGRALALPVAAYLLTVWALHVRRCSAGSLEMIAYVVGALLVLIAPIAGPTAAPCLIAGILVLLTTITVRAPAS